MYIVHKTRFSNIQINTKRNNVFADLFISMTSKNSGIPFLIPSSRYLQGQPWLIRCCTILHLCHWNIDLRKKKMKFSGNRQFSFIYLKISFVPLSLSLSYFLRDKRWYVNCDLMTNIRKKYLNVQLKNKIPKQRVELWLESELKKWRTKKEISV